MRSGIWFLCFLFAPALSAAPQFAHPVLSVMVDAPRLHPDSSVPGQYLLKGGGIPLSWSADGSSSFELELKQGTHVNISKWDSASIVLTQIRLSRQSQLRVRAAQPQQTEWSEPVSLKLRLEPPEPLPEAQGSFDPNTQNYTYDVAWKSYPAPLRVEIDLGDTRKRAIPGLKPAYSTNTSIKLRVASSKISFWRARFVSESGEDLSDWSDWVLLPREQAHSFRIASVGLFPKKRFRFWLSGGLTYVSYNQKSSQLASNLDFQSISPSLTNIRLESQLSDNWRALLSYKNLQGKAAGEKDVQLNSEDYGWTILDAGIQWHSSQLKPTILDLFYRPYLHGGWQQHRFPYLEKRNSTFSITDRSLQKLLVGAGTRIGPFSEGYIEIEMNYAHLLSKDSRYQISKNFGFEGSLSYYKKLNSWLLGGVAWYGHYDQSTFQDTGISSVEFDEKFLYSRFEFRLGAEF